MSPTIRQQLIDEFSSPEGSAVLVSQIEAGGSGLNIQAASVVILTEPQKWRWSKVATCVTPRRSAAAHSINVDHDGHGAFPSYDQEVS